jgi:hypothetical protein
MLYRCPIPLYAARPTLLPLTGVIYPYYPITRVAASHVAEIAKVFAVFVQFVQFRTPKRSAWD